MRLPHNLVLALLPLALSLACAKTSSANSSGSTQTDIELTGIDSFDSVFTQARDIDERLDSARQAMKDGRHNLNNALGLSSGTPFADAVSELYDRAQGKLTVAVQDGGGIQLQASDAVPSNVQSAIDSLNDTLGNYQDAITGMAGIKDDATNLASSIKSLPTQLQTDFKNLDLSLNEVPSKLETVRKNGRIIGKMPSRINKLSTAMKNNVTLVTDIASGKNASVSSSSSSSSSSTAPAGSSGSSGGSRTLKRK